ncbi:MAG: iron ABC transporter permease [Candidatus Heimdallarchaeota archaeon]|nr:iron ABC transporter permease [Candidatus Heimdallarchaeota archaeon]
MAKTTADTKTARIFGMLLPVILIALFLFFPVISVLISGFKGEEGFSFSYLRNVLSDGYYYKIFAFTLSQALLSTIVSLAIGIPIGYFFGKYDFKGKKIFLTFFTVPFVLPTVLVGMGFISLFGGNGLFGLPIFSIILAHAFYNIPLVVHYLSAYYQNFDKNLISAAKTLGSKNFHLLFRLYLPLFLTPILSASILTFLFCFMSYGIVLILGAENLTFGARTIETQIFAEYFKGEPNIASILALLQILVTIAVVVGYLFFMRRKSKKEKTITTEVFPQEKIKKRFFRKPVNIILLTFLTIGLALELAPLISIIINSFWDPYTSQFVNNFNGLFSSDISSAARIGTGRAIMNTLKFALSSAAFASLLAIITVIVIGERRYKKTSISLEMLTYLPLTISSATLSLGITQTFITSSFFSNNPWVFIIISQGLLGYPFITRALLNGLNTIDPEIIDSAKILGAKFGYKLWKIYFPLLFKSFIAGFAFALGLSISEFTVVNFFATLNDSVATLTVMLYRLRNVRLFGAASALGVILMLISYVSFFILEWLGAREKSTTKII